MKLIASSAAKSWSEMAGIVNRAGGWKIFKSIIFCRGVDWEMTQPRILWLFVLRATKKLTEILEHGDVALMGS